MESTVHGRLLTAWAMAGIIGPVVVNLMREYKLGLSLPRAQVYNQTTFILVMMLVAGLICNLLVQPLKPKWFKTPEELAVEKQLKHGKVKASEVHGDDTRTTNQVPPSFCCWPERWSGCHWRGALTAIR